MRLPNGIQAEVRRILWNSRIAQSPPTVEYRAIMNADDNGVLRCLDKVVRRIACLCSPQHDFGFCFVTDVPPTATDTEEVIKRIGPIRETHCEVSCESGADWRRWFLGLYLGHVTW